MLTGSTTVKSAIKKWTQRPSGFKVGNLKHFSNKVKHLCWRGALSMSTFHIFSLPVSDYESQEVFNAVILNI